MTPLLVSPSRALAAKLSESLTLNPALIRGLSATFGPTSNTTLLQSLTCGGLLSQTCIAICPNQDLAGIGVRVAFYFQSLVTGEPCIMPVRR